MNLRPMHLIVFSLIVFLMDFLILANKVIFPGNTIDGFLVVVIAFMCLLIFISGIIWAVMKSISGKTQRRVITATPPSTQPQGVQDQFALTPLEICLTVFLRFC